MEAQKNIVKIETQECWKNQVLSVISDSLFQIKDNQNRIGNHFLQHSLYISLSFSHTQSYTNTHTHKQMIKSTQKKEKKQY